MNVNFIFIKRNVDIVHLSRIKTCLNFAKYAYINTIGIVFSHEEKAC